MDERALQFYGKVFLTVVTQPLSEEKCQCHAITVTIRHNCQTSK